MRRDSASGVADRQVAADQPDGGQVVRTAEQRAVQQVITEVIILAVVALVVAAGAVGFEDTDVLGAVGVVRSAVDLGVSGLIGEAHELVLLILSHLREAGGIGVPSGSDAGRSRGRRRAAATGCRCEECSCSDETGQRASDVHRIPFRGCRVGHGPVAVRPC